MAVSIQLRCYQRTVTEIQQIEVKLPMRWKYFHLEMEKLKREAEREVDRLGQV